MLLVGSRRAAFTKTSTRFSWAMWGIPSLLAFASYFLVRNPVIWGPVVMFGVFGSIVLVLQLQIFLEEITWDELNIYARSAFRSRRMISIVSVRKCVYLPDKHTYRIHGEGYRTIDLHIWMSGIPQLLAAIPCATPPYPPPRS